MKRTLWRWSMCAFWIGLAGYWTYCVILMLMGHYPGVSALSIMVVILGLLACGISLFGLLRSEAHPPGLCPTCSYDLRASPERCPEMFSPLQRADSSFFAPCHAPSRLRGY